MSAPASGGRAAAVLAGGAGLAATAVAHWVFPFGSTDNDEGIYRLQAEAMRHGHLFLPVPSAPRPFTPWLATVVDHHYVLKYTPLEPTLLAVSKLVSGSYLPALALVAASVVAATWALGREVFADGRKALAAAALVAACPLVVVQGGLLLAYLLTLSLVEVFSWATLRAVRVGGSGRWAAPAGLALGLAASVRPYDAVLLGLPVVVWAGVRLHRRGSVAGAARWFLAGGSGPAVGLGVYDRLATGHVFGLPFNLLEHRDNVGFGVRRLFPGDRPHHFGVVEGLAGVGNHLGLLLVWVTGGPLLVLLAIAGWRRLARPRKGRGTPPESDLGNDSATDRGALWALAAAAGLLTIGYVAFWGVWNAADLWGGITMVGPFYLLPLVVPLCLLAAEGLVALRSRPRLLVAAVAGLAAVTVAALIPAAVGDARASRQDGRLEALARRAPQLGGGAALVLVPGQGPFVMHPVGRLGNGWKVGGPLVVGAASGTSADLDALASVPGHAPFLLTLSRGYSPRPAHPGGRLVRMVLTEAAAITLEVTPAGGRPAPAAALTVAAAGQTLSCGPADGDGRWRVRLGGDGSVGCGATDDVLGAGALGPAPGGLRLAMSQELGLPPVSVLVATSVANGTVRVLTAGDTVGTTGRPPPPVPLSVTAR
ncbi:MAG TPA: hypothetical protein VF954_03720 [Acidimicrobiales bacterium]